MMNKALLKAFVREEKNERKIQSALKLKELVKERIKESDEGMKSTDYVSTKHNYWQTLNQELQSLGDKSEK